MDSGFRLEHFDLLERHGGRPASRSPEALADRERMRDAYRATRAWAETLQAALFPSGRAEGRMAVVNQGGHLSPYTWWRIYPTTDAPRELAYTVGIDRSGEFIVKLDTYQPTAAVRAAYLAERGPTNDGSPFAGVMSAKEGVRLSRERLVEWSVAEIATFRPDYRELAFRIGIDVDPGRILPLRLLEDGDGIRRSLASWVDALREGAIVRGGVSWVPEGPFVARFGSGANGEIEVELGLDPSGRRWLVRVNEARRPGSPNTLSAVASDGRGRSYLLRQGMLRGGGIREEIDAPRFAERTGLAAVAVEASPTGIERDWFLVAALYEPPATIRAMTAAFVAACADARLETPSGPRRDRGLRLGADETGGTYVIGAAGPREDRTVLRRHGIVWLALQEILGRSGIAIGKPGHALGYEVDAAFERSGRAPLLVEIKTVARSSDIHTGVGQLHLYPALIPELGLHDRALLLPDTPAREIVDALDRLGIAVGRYDFGDHDDGGDLRFDEAFLALCGAS